VPKVLSIKKQNAKNTKHEETKTKSAKHQEAKRQALKKQSAKLRRAPRSTKRHTLSLKEGTLEHKIT
jgi:hypothetical protein